MNSDHKNGFEVAIVGAGGRFPGANDLEQFWRNLRDGVESLSRFSREEIEPSARESGLFDDRNYVPVRGVLSDVEYFDAEFFGFSPREAEMTDPQHRIFLECASEVCERAGYDPQNYAGRIALFAGMSTNTYFWSCLYPNLENLETGNLPLLIGNEKDFLTTRVAYKLNLRGPSVTVQTACSTSLVAVHLACQSLLSGECNMAMAGGVSVVVPQNGGYLYQESGIQSPDGHCRAFDARARGTVSGSGMGIVLLKRLADALADGDQILAVIKGSAINNDGNLKVGFTAPRTEGQARVIRSAIALAEVEVESIGYVETHGTGTTLGDPIEVAALTQAFRTGSSGKQFCAIGSVKSNMGHLDAAAGVAGLLKTVLALQHGEIPASLHFEQPNPQIDFAHSPFYVNRELQPWKRGQTPRRAGVSSFGIGGTNAHVIVEEAPEPQAGEAPVRAWEVLVLSGRTAAAVEKMSTNLAEHLGQHGEQELADVSYTLQTGRREFAYRRALVCGSREEAIAGWSSGARWLSRQQEGRRHPVVFLFPGQGAQRVNMGRGLYRQERVFREELDVCVEVLKPELGRDLREVLFAAAGQEQEKEAEEQLRRTGLTQPAMFVVEYALARLWMSWGLEPEAMLGHSVGEYVAACLAGVFSLADALRLVALRGRLVEQLPGGAMVAVPLGERAVEELLNGAELAGAELDIAAVNLPEQCTVAGGEEEIGKLEREMERRGLKGVRLHTSHAFHSRMMEGAVAELERAVEGVKRQRPRLKYLSNVSGSWVGEEEAMRPEYWGRHLRHRVRFAEAVGELAKEPGRILLEVGPGQTLGSLCRRHSGMGAGQTIVASLGGKSVGEEGEGRGIMQALAEVWLAGGSPNWAAVHGTRRLRVALPTYPFARRRFWIDPPEMPASKALPEPEIARSEIKKDSRIANWFWTPSWRLGENPVRDASTEKPVYLCFEHDHKDGLDAAIANHIEATGGHMIHVVPGHQFSKSGEAAYTIDPKESSHYEALAQHLQRSGQRPKRVVHLWTITPRRIHNLKNCHFHTVQFQGFYSLLWLMQSFSRYGMTDGLEVNVISNWVHNLSGSEPVCPAKTTMLGLAKVITQEFSGIRCRCVDIDYPRFGQLQKELLVEQIVREMNATHWAPVSAYRGTQRWLPSYTRRELESGNPASSANPGLLRRGGVYLITGGTGRIGLKVAEYLTRHAEAKVVLVGRSAGLLEGEDDDRLQASESIQSLRREGAEILLVSANVADRDSMEEAFLKAEKKFGSVHGLIHAAGVSESQLRRPVSECTRDDCRPHFEAKVEGAFVLARLLRRRKMDFCISFSSLSTVLGGLGFGVYSATNHFLNAFAEYQNRIGNTRWINIQWDGWRFPDEEKGSGASAEHLDMLPDEGIEAFARILEAGDLDQIVVSTADLNARLQRWAMADLRDPAPAASRNGGRKRRELDDRFVPPRAPAEKIMAGIWETLLGMEPIGTTDNFFELGGDSLLGLQLISRIRQKFQADLPVTVIYKHSILRDLVEALERHLVEIISRMPEEQVLQSIGENGSVVSAAVPSGQSSR